MGLDYLSPSKKFGFSLIGGHINGMVNDYSVDMSNTELQLRYHPWATAFYGGISLGNHVVKVSQTRVIDSQAVTGEAQINAGYVTPQVGWIANFDSGFMLGFELGWLIPTSNSTQFSSDAPTSVQSTSDYTQFVSDVKDQGDTIGKTGLPYVTLLRVGWTF